MKKIIVIISCILGLSVLLTANNNDEGDQFANATATASECGMSNDVFEVGESLKYRVYYNWTAVWMRAGHATFNIKSAELEGKSVFHMISEGTTAKAFNWVFKVKDRYETYMDPVKLRPLKFIRDVKEGKYTKQNQFTFKHDEKKVLMNHRIRKGKVQTKDELADISSCTQDLLSAIYYSRCLDYSTMKKGATTNVEVFIDGDLYPIKVRYMGKDVLKTKKGKFNCVKFSPELIESDAFKGGEGLMTVWATDDENRLPLLIESPLSVGSVKAYLIDFDGLKHELTSKIK